MRGVIYSWGAKGFGFVEAEGVQARIWTHMKYLASGTYDPRSGDEVEFELVKLTDGRLQAHHVRPIGAARRAPVIISVPATPAPASPSFGTLGSRLAAAGAAAVVPPKAPPEPSGLQARLTERSRVREEELARAAAQEKDLRAQLAQLEARVQQLAAQTEAAARDQQQRRERVAGEVQAAIAGHLRSGCDSFHQAVSDRQTREEAATRTKAAATSRVGASAVSEYLEVRRRLATPTEAKDQLARTAYEMLERDRRAALREYAAALDGLDAAPAVVAKFVTFTEPGSTTLVAPLSGDVRLDAGAVATRLACAFWQAAERAARELGGGCTVEDGTIAGALAVRLPIETDHALLEILLDEDVSTRPTLDRLGVEVALEHVTGISAPFVEAPGADVVVATPTTGPVLPDVARRLGLSLRDLVAVLTDRGLPFPDDELDGGAETTLRTMLGQLPAAPVGAPRATVAEAAEPEAAGISGNAAIASRMLAKLLRDRRVGGCHTRKDNAWGHHFSDGEKNDARRVADWLEKDGIFIPKNNEGSHHISINPRRLRDVRQIIDGVWARAEELERV